MAFITININEWKRKAPFEMYRTYTDPLFNVSSLIEVTELRQYALSHKLPFSQCLFYHSLAVCNEIEELRTRIRNGEVVMYDVVHGGSTVANPDGTFGFNYFDYVPGESLQDFVKHFNTRGSAQIPEDEGKPLTARNTGPKERYDLVRHTVLPWTTFTSVKHPRSGQEHDCIPKISFGRFYEDGLGRVMMPVNVEGHHGLMDGLHASMYINELEKQVSGEE